MMRKLFYALLCLLLLGGVSCNSSSNKEDKKATVPEIKQKRYYKRFEGKIKDEKAILHLIKYNSSVHRSREEQFIQYSGTFIPNKDSSPLIISGYRENDSIVQLVAYEQFSPVDTLTGRLSDNAFQGMLKTEEGKSLPVQLKTNYPKGSGHWIVDTFKDSVSVDTLKEAPKAIADFMTLWPGKGMSSSAQKTFKDSVSQSYYGQKKTLSSTGEIFKATADSFFIEYEEAANKMLKDSKGLRPTLNWTYLTYMNMTCNVDNRMSSIFTEYKYLGGAHGLQTERGYTIDLQTGKVLHLTDLFKSGFKKELQKVLENKFRQQYNLPKGDSLNGKNGLLFEDHLKVTSNFYLTPYGIGFIYNPYEVAPYAVGIINLYIPFQDIQGVLKK